MNEAKTYGEGSLNSKQNRPKPFPPGAYIQKYKNKINKQHVQGPKCVKGQINPRSVYGDRVAGRY